MGNIDIAIAKGDGIGPEIMQACLKILSAAGCALNFREIEVGEKVYLKGFATGIEPKSWDILNETKAFLKAPITTPQGGGFRSLNVTIRTALGLYANVRPCVSYAPFIDTKHPAMDVVIVRENEEDLYTGIEYRQSFDSYHAIKIITRKASERIIRYAFEYARGNNRKKVTAFTKDNILKMTDGTFHKIFDEIAKEYPDIIAEHWIVDIGAAKLADSPENFDVVVLANLYGDILSDVAAQIAGSVGIAGSANIGEKGAMFEAIHGSAPRRAGQNLANPSGLILASVMMLQHIGQGKSAELIHNAWLKTIEDGIHTYDIFEETKSHEKVGTKEFSDAVIQRLGKLPEKLKPVHIGMHHAKQKTQNPSKNASTDEQKRLVGVDLYIDSEKNPVKAILQLSQGGKLTLTKAFNRGLAVYPEEIEEASFSDTWRLRFMGEKITPYDILELYKKFTDAAFDVVKQENLYYFGREAGFSHADS